MKKAIFIFTILSCSLFLNSFTNSNSTNLQTVEIIKNSNFCDGWEDGYCEGWKDVKGSNSLCPLTPLCPLPRLGEDTYRGGYNRGFKAGSRAAYNRN